MSLVETQAHRMNETIPEPDVRSKVRSTAGSVAKYYFEGWWKSRARKREAKQRRSDDADSFDNQNPRKQTARAVKRSVRHREKHRAHNFEILKLRQEGWSYRRIGAYVSLNASSVKRILDGWNGTFRRRGQALVRRTQRGVALARVSSLRGQ